MSFLMSLKIEMEDEEITSVGTSFGGQGNSRSFSLVRIRDWILRRLDTAEIDESVELLRQIQASLTATVFSKVVAGLIRFSFLIELTDLKVGSTKMKTRWLEGFILMPQPNSFEPVQGLFQPGNDPRSTSFEGCVDVFINSCRLLQSQLVADAELPGLLADISKWNRVPYEFPLGYIDPDSEPVHFAENIAWIANDDIRWLVKARRILGTTSEPHKTALDLIESRKLEVKSYKTDRALTGKDKTNRAKRWEVLAGDFQHATLESCWSVERALTVALINFEAFPETIRDQFAQNGLSSDVRGDVTRCPVTLAPLNYPSFAASVVSATHGRSDYQVGHLSPLKRGGRHIGANICWQSADGNRIQGDLTIQETEDLLNAIAGRRQQLNWPSSY